MDPLSITAGVVGLVATATKISATLSEVCTSVSDAPESARAVLAAVETTRLSLNSIKHLFDTISTLPSERKALIRLDHIAVTCSQCVLTLSELESLVCGELVKNGPASSMLTRIKWTWNEKKVLCLLTRLEAQKNCISLMISVLQCQSWADAFKDSTKLDEVVDTILQGDGDLAGRIERSGVELEAHTGPVGHGGLEYRIDPTPDDGLLHIYLSGESDEQASTKLRGFEEDLEASRVYKRAERNEVDAMSIRASTIWTTCTRLSDFSMNNLSIMAVYRLPVTLNDINTFGGGLTFADIMGPRPVLRGQDRRPTSQSQVKHPTLQRIGSPSSTLGRSPREKRLPPQSRRPQTITIRLVGDPAFEKSRLVHRYVHKTSQNLPLSPNNNYTIVTRIRNTQFIVNIVDIKEIISPHPDIFIICAKIPSWESFDNIETIWVPEIQKIKPGAPFLIVGITNNNDYADRRVSHADLKEAASRENNLTYHKKAWKYMSCNLQSQSDVNQVFGEAILAFLNREKGNGRMNPVRVLGEREHRVPVSAPDTALDETDEGDWSHCLRAIPS